MAVQVSYRHKYCIAMTAIERKIRKEEGKDLLLAPFTPRPDWLGIACVPGCLVLELLESLLPQTSSGQLSPLPEPLMSSPMQRKTQGEVGNCSVWKMPSGQDSPWFQELISQPSWCRDDGMPQASERNEQHWAPLFLCSPMNGLFAHQYVRACTHTHRIRALERTWHGSEAGGWTSCCSWVYVTAIYMAEAPMNHLDPPQTSTGNTLHCTLGRKKTLTNSSISCGGTCSVPGYLLYWVKHRLLLSHIPCLGIPCSPRCPTTPCQDPCRVKCWPVPHMETWVSTGPSMGWHGGAGWHEKPANPWHPMPPCQDPCFPMKHGSVQDSVWVSARRHRALGIA